MLGFLRTTILCAKLLYRKQTKKRKKERFSFVHSYKKQAYFLLLMHAHLEKMSFCSAISLILLRLDFSWGLSSKQKQIFLSCPVLFPETLTKISSSKGHYLRLLNCELLPLKSEKQPKFLLASR